MCDKIIVWSRSEYKIMTTNYLSWKELIRNFLRDVEASSTGVQIMSFHVVDSEWTSNKCVEMKKNARAWLCSWSMQIYDFLVAMAVITEF